MTGGGKVHLGDAPEAAARPAEESLLRSLFFAYPDALLLVNGNGLIERANPTAARLLGYDEGELAGISVDTLVPQAIRSRHADFRSGYAEAPRSRPMGLQMELVALRKDGSEVMVEIALSPLQHQGQAFVVAAIRDIAAYPRVQQALQRARYSEHLAQLGRLAVDERDPQVVLDHGPAVAVEALRADSAMVFLLEGNGVEFSLVSGVGLLRWRTHRHAFAQPGRYPARLRDAAGQQRGRARVGSTDPASNCLPTAQPPA